MKIRSLKQLGTRIFWGCLILTIHLNIGVFTILPAWIGWCLIATSIEQLELLMKHIEGVKAIRRAKVTSCLMIVVTFVLSFIPFVNQRYFTNGSISYWIICILEFCTFYFLLDGISKVEPKREGYYKIRGLIYCILFTSFYIVVWLSTYLFNRWEITMLFTCLLLITRLWIASVIRSFCLSSEYSDWMIHRWLSVFGKTVTDEVMKEHVLEEGNFLWHIFTWGEVTSLKGKDATTALERQDYDTAYIFFGGFYNENAVELGLVGTVKKSIAIELISDEDVYIVDPEFEWTYVQTHENTCGPYFTRMEWEKEEAKTL